MKTFMIVTSLAFILFSKQAYAIEGTRGGGKGVVCRDSQGKIKSVELLDLWEANALYNRPVKRSNAPVKIQALTALEGVGEAMNFVGETAVSAVGSLGNVMQENMVTTVGQFLDAKPNYPLVQHLKHVSLVLTDDSYEIAKPDRCAIEQIVDYNDANEKVYLNDDLYAQMNSTNKAALAVHEAIYRQLRSSSSETDSLRTRRAVGYIFSGKKLPVSKISAPYVSCWGGSPVNGTFTEIAFYGNTDQKTASSVIRSNAGHQLIGFFPKTVSVTGDSVMMPTGDQLETLLTQAACPVMPATGILMVWSGSDENPISYESGLGLVLTCDNNKLKMRFHVDNENGIQTPTSHLEMTCKRHDTLD